MKLDVERCAHDVGEALVGRIGEKNEDTGARLERNKRFTAEKER